MAALHLKKPELAKRIHTILMNIASPTGGEKLTNPLIKEHAGLNADDVVTLVEHLESKGKDMTITDVSEYMRRLKFRRMCAYIMEHPHMTDDFVHQSRSMFLPMYV
jgi:hypothetical protein